MSNHIVNEGGTDAAATTSTSAALVAGEVFSGHLDGRDDSDWIRVELAAGASYMIRVAPRDPDGAGPQGAAADTVLEIFNAAGDSVVRKDDLSKADEARYPSADALHPIVMFESKAAGVYYLSVSSYARVAATDNSGGYSLELTRITPLDPNRDMELTGTAGADKLAGAGGSDTLRGGAGNDFLNGGGANDALFGEAGDDLLEGGPGADALNGGANGSAGDAITYASSAAAVRVNLGKMTAAGGEAEGDVFENVENIIGSAGDDWLRGDVNDNRLTGGAGDDTLIGGGGGNDILSGGAGDDTLNGGEGDDTLNGGAGADTITGGPGGDTLSYAGSDRAVDIRLSTGQASGGHADGDVYRDVEHVTGSNHGDLLAGDNRPAGASAGGDNILSGGGGADEIYGGGGDDVLNGDGGDDTLYGGTGDDELDGGAGNDALIGGAGDDELDGGAGNDALIGGAGADRFTGGAGEDTVSYATAQDEKVTIDLTWTARQSAADPNNPSHSDGDYFPRTDVENVIGSPRGDTITGNDSANKLLGGPGADTLNGGAGNDIIDGGPGGDAIDGGGNSANGDTATYANSDAGVRVTVNTATGNEGGDAEGDRLSNIENLVGSDHDDRLFGDGEINELSGGDGDDRIVAGAGVDAVEGGAGADTMDGDADEYAATPNDSDFLSYASSAGGVTIDLSGQYAVAASATQQRGHYAAGSGGDAEGDKFRGFENVIGGRGNDRLTGDGFNNILIGGPGADRLDGGAPQTTGAGADGQFGTADDVMTPADTDTVSYAGSTAGVTITFSERRLNDRDVTIGEGLGGDAEGDRLLNIELVVGTARDDLFIASNLTQMFDGGVNARAGNSMTNAERAGNDTVSFANLDDPVNLLLGSSFYRNIENAIGGSGNDIMRGDDNPNRLEGGAGADTLTGFNGADTLIGGPGDDRLIGASGFDLLNGGPGADNIDGDSGGTQTRADVQSFENFHGGRVNVDNNLAARAASYGGDTVAYAGSNRGVALTLGQLNPATWVSTGTAGEGGYARGDTVVNVENITGSDHDDSLGGNNWHNVLTGGKGDDRLTGDASAGGAQSDIFVFAPGDSTGPSGDVITDFNVSGVTLDDDSDGTPNADIYGNTIHYQRDAIDLRAFNFNLARNADRSIATTLAQLESQGLKISNLMDADGDEQGADGKDDREITLPDGGKITLLSVGDAALSIDNFIFDLA